MNEYYRVLGLEAGATAQEIKSAFRRLAKKYHPDKNSGHRAEEQFMLVHQAYQMLSGDHFKAAVKHVYESKPKNSIAYAVYVKPRQKVSRFSVHDRRRKIREANTYNFPTWAVYTISIVGFVLVLAGGVWMHTFFRAYSLKYYYENGQYYEALKIDEFYGPAYFGLANKKVEMHNYRHALLDYNRAIEYTKNPDAVYYLSRGNCLMAVRRYEEAAFDYDKALATKVTLLQEKELLSRAADLNAYLLEKLQKSPSVL